MMMPSVKAVILVVVAALSLALVEGRAMGEGAPSWRAVMEETCAKSNEAMAMSVKELTALLEKCDSLEKAIQQEEESVRKVYLKRLSMCRNLYAYVLDYKKNNGEAATASRP